MAEDAELEVAARTTVSLERIVAVVARSGRDLVPALGDRRSVGTEVVLDVRVVILPDDGRQVARRVDAEGVGLRSVEVLRKNLGEGVLDLAGREIDGDTGRVAEAGEIGNGIDAVAAVSTIAAISTCWALRTLWA